jgi:moderate conductance mechanosensitive channel
MLMTAHAWEQLIGKLLDMGVNAAQDLIRIALLIAAAYIATKVLRAALNRLEAFLVYATERTETIPGAAGKRVRTLTGVLWTIGCGLLWFVVVLVAFSQFGLNIGPILAGAGVAGLAVGFGAQNLVKDLVSGFFLILENQVRVGDVAVINGTGGLVEAITFRTVVLRDMAAVVHVFPNGSINTLSNMTKDWSAYIIDLGVAYKEDTDRVVEVMRQVADEMRAEPQFGAAMIEPIEIFGVDDFADSAVKIKARLKTVPLQQWTVGREYRRRLKKALDLEKIEIPFPHQTLYMGEVSPSFRVAVEHKDGAISPRN